MLVSWNWLNDYVSLDMPRDQLALTLTMAGLNHEETRQEGADWMLHLEVTSNRPDCLGHLGVAREAAVLWDRELKLPAAAPAAKGPPVDTLARVRIEAPDLCPRYTARVIRGVKVGPSPAWLRDRLATIGVAAINNVVDVTNYVLMENGQPLHAFDLAKLSEREIVVRRARSGEILAAINHKQYPLEAEMCVIADARRPVGLAGVMGGADTEVNESTKDILIESALFSPLSIRATARRLNLHSDASYRFERALDPAGVDWASRRCCELILQVAGGELAAGVLDVGEQPRTREPVALRFGQLRRVLGIDVAPSEAQRILLALGCEEVGGERVGADATSKAHGQNRERLVVVPPSWRGDLEREIDLVEEVARIHGYDKIPENVRVPMAASHRTREDRVLGKVRQALTAAGFDEALTLSAIEESWAKAFSPWTKSPALRSSTPVLRRADRLRLSLIPSLLAVRQTNESLSNETIELFEIAKVYLPSEAPGQLPREELMISLASGGDYLAVKGVAETLAATLAPGGSITAAPTQLALLDAQRSCELRWSFADGGEETLGYLGEVTPAGRKQFDLRGPATVCELRLAPLLAAANLAPQAAPLSNFPAVTRDLNLVVDERMAWADLERTVRRAAGSHAERLTFRDVYRDDNRLGPGKKSLLFTITLRLPDATLTGDEADAAREKIVAARAAEHGAQLRAG